MLTTDVQQFNLGQLVSLFQLDLTSIDTSLGIIYFAPNTLPNGSGGYTNVSFGGNIYVPLDVQCEGFEESTQGALPRPSMKVSNVNQALGAYIVNYDDIIGAKLTRLRTFSKYLDGQPNADPTKFFPPDIYFVERKVNQNPVYVEFQLATILELQGVRLPFRQVIRDYCLHIYRYYVNGAFNYEGVTCPYTGTSCWDNLGNAQTDPSLDQCGKREPDCKLRFSDNILPTRAFLGIERVDITQGG